MVERMSTPGAASTRGVVFVHSCPRAVSPHVEWALSGVLGTRVTLDWTAQPVTPDAVRAELSWAGAAGTAAAIASALRGWSGLRFEITEEPTPGTEGERYAFTPDLGIFRATIGVHGDVLVSEERLRAAMARTLDGVEADGGPVDDEVPQGQSGLAEEITRLLGQPWDDELEPFRLAGADAPVRWLHQVV